MQKNKSFDAEQDRSIPILMVGIWSAFGRFVGCDVDFTSTALVIFVEFKKDETIKGFFEIF